MLLPSAIHWTGFAMEAYRVKKKEPFYAVSMYLDVFTRKSFYQLFENQQFNSLVNWLMLAPIIVTSLKEGFSVVILYLI